MSKKRFGEEINGKKRPGKKIFAKKKLAIKFWGQNISWVEKRILVKKIVCFKKIGGEKVCGRNF